MGIKQDYELAKFFGISAPSFNARKKNNNFPIKKLKEILEQRSDLSYVDLRWVLTGKKGVIGDDLINKLKELTETQQETICMIVKEFHKNLH